MKNPGENIKRNVRKTGAGYKNFMNAGSVVLYVNNSDNNVLSLLTSVRLICFLFFSGSQ
jgi:hypothetical protein